jgi:drug/metabolite transporter (DMT)-like permease
MKRLKGTLFILGGTAFWGLSATIAKLLFTQTAGIGPLVLVQMRMTVSCVVLFAVIAVFRRELLHVEAKDLHRFAMLGILGVAGSNFTYYFAIRETSVATAILLQYLAPLLVLAYGALSGEEGVGAVKVVAAAVSLAGCFLAVGGRGLSPGSGSTIGILSGFGAAFCWSFSNIYFRRLIRRYSVWTILVYAFIAASLFWLVVNPPWKIVEAHYPGATWGTFVVFAVVSILIPHSLYFNGLRYLTASQAIITATFEPVVAIVSAYIILAETLSAVQGLGAVLVIAAIVLLQLAGEREKAA